MKANAAQIASAIDRPTSDVRLFLFHGPDESAAYEFADRLGRAMGADAQRIDLDNAALKSRPALLADEAASMSLFGERRYIRVGGIGEDGLAAVEQLLDAPVAGNPVVAIGPSLKSSGKLVKLATASRGALAFACYVPDAAQAARNAAATAHEQGVRLMGDCAALMVEASGGDRAVLAREIEKLALYLDAAPERPKDADMAALEAIGANLSDTGMFDAIEAIVDGRPDVLGSDQAALDPAMTIPLLRQLSRRLIALADMRSEVDAGASADEVTERRRVFWKEKPATIRALRRWTSPQLATAIMRVRRAEGAMLMPGTAGSVIADAECLTIARVAARAS